MVITYESELYHYGVKGMKWGVRKQRASSGNLRKPTGMVIKGGPQGPKPPSGSIVMRGPNKKIPGTVIKNTTGGNSASVIKGASTSGKPYNKVKHLTGEDLGEAAAKLVSKSDLRKLYDAEQKKDDLNSELSRAINSYMSKVDWSKTTSSQQKVLMAEMENATADLNRKATAANNAYNKELTRISKDYTNIDLIDVYGDGSLGAKDTKDIEAFNAFEWAMEDRMWDEDLEHSDQLYHHGVKGQKWGVRRYQFEDGTRTPLGRKREGIKNSSGIKRFGRVASMKVSEMYAKVATIATGKQYADTYLKKGTSFKRIQTSKEFENFAFYATYKQADSDKYMGLFGKNLTSRANAAAKAAEKKAKETGDEADIAEAKELRNKADTTKVYQLSINTTKKLKIPSDDNASYIVTNLLKDKSFRSDLEQSLADSKEKMRRPTQQLLFNQAQKALKGDPSKMTKQDRIAVYKAFNLSLTNHNDYEVRAQDAFYGELKKKGYNALLDYNDKEYSSYHAKRPMIVFDLGAVKLQSVTETNPKIVDKMYAKYNADRLLKDIPTNTIGYLARAGKKTVDECNSYVQHKVDGYLQ